MGIGYTYVIPCFDCYFIISYFTAPRIRLLSVDDDDNDDVTSSDNNGGLSEEEDDEDEIMDDRNNDDNVIGKLRELAEVVEVCLQSNPGMQSTVLISASKDLLKTYKSKLVWPAWLVMGGCGLLVNVVIS